MLRTHANDVVFLVYGYWRSAWRELWRRRRRTPAGHLRPLSLHCRSKTFLVVNLVMRVSLIVLPPPPLTKAEEQ